MINLLIDNLPESVTIDGIDYCICSDFKTLIRINLILNSEDENVAERCLKLFYGGKIPANIEKAVDRLIWFYNGGEVLGDKKEEPEQEGIGENNKSQDTSHKPPVYSYEYDHTLIYSAFYEQYGIDLLLSNMHWWKFKALFDTLGGNTLFAEVRKIRTVEINSNMSKAQQNYYREMKKLYALPLPKTEQKMLDEITDALQNGGNVAEVMRKYEKG